MEIVKALREAVRSMKVEAYIVGGYPRDMLIGKESKDIDVVVFENAEELVEKLKTTLGNYVYIGRDNPIFRFTKGEYQIDISRGKGKELFEDLVKRDFTINTLVIPLHADCDEILDPLGYAKSDLRSEVLRCPRSPSETLAEDPIRVIRLARFMSELLNSSVSESLIDAARRNALRLSEMPYERMGEEIRNLFLASKPSIGLLFLRDINAFKWCFPRLEPALWKEQKSPYHFEGVFEHCLRVMDIVPPEPSLRIAAFFHDLGKAFCERTIEKGGKKKVVYWGHEEISWEIAREFLTNFKFPRDEREIALFIIKNHMINYTDKWTDSAIRRLISRLGDKLDIVLEFVWHDTHALKDPKPALNALQNLKERIKNELIKLKTRRITSPLTGYEIQDILGIRPGPLVGKLRKALEEAVIEGQIAPDDKKRARKYLMDIAKKLKLPDLPPVEGQKKL